MSVSLTVAAIEDVHAEKTCLHSDRLSPSTAHKSNKPRAHEPTATSHGPTDTLQKLLISRMCSLTFVLLCAGIMFLYSAPSLSANLFQIKHSNKPGEQEWTLGGGDLMFCINSGELGSDV